IVTALAVGLLLAADVPKGGTARAEESYAKVELKGQFGRDGVPGHLRPVVRVGEDTYELDMRRGKAAPTEKELKRLDGEMVIVLGDLWLGRDRRLHVRVRQITVVQEKHK